MSQPFPNIHQLENRVLKGMPKYHFSDGSKRAEIEVIEKAYSILFSKSYKLFLEKFNGGMICEFEDHYYTDMTDWEPDGPKESSFYFYSLNELIDVFRDLRLEDEFVEEGFKGSYPFIPICKTPNQDLLFMISQKGLKEESPVFISYDKKDLNHSEQIAPNFDHFIGYYLEHEGFPPLKQYRNHSLCIDYVKKKKLLKIAQESESSQEVIERNNALIKLFPDDGMNYLERANAYLDDGLRELALADYNKAIELNPEDAFFYYCRGSFIAEFGSMRRALVDLDIAVQLKPDDPLYLSGRADALYHLGKLEKALDDCNKILAKDGIYTFALYTRVRIYRDLGKHDKADADSALLDDLLR